MKFLRAILFSLSLLALSHCGPRTDLFRPLKPQTETLGHGMEIYYLEDRELPTLQLLLYIRGGTARDPQGKEGLASIAMQTIRLGGSAGRTPDDIENALEFVGASLEMGAAPEYETASLALLVKDTDLGLDLLFDLLQRPSLDPGRFEIAKKRAKEAILREREDPLALASKAYPPLVYGPGSAWGRSSTIESIDRITLEDVRDFHRRFIAPDRIVLAASGDLSLSQLKDKINERTKDWPPLKTLLPEIPPLKESYEKGFVVIPQKGLTQSTILIGHLGSKRDNPDKFPLLVMNYILGGGGSLTSRLGEEIRSSAGKAYGVWSEFGFGRDFGVFRSVAQTALENTEWVIRKMKEMITQTATSPNFTDEEISRAKESILRSLFFDYETRFAQVKELARFHLWGYPDNYLETFQKKIRNVSPSDLKRVAKTYLRPETLKVLVVTDADAAGDQLSRLNSENHFGKMEVKPLP